MYAPPPVRGHAYREPDGDRQGRAADDGARAARPVRLPPSRARWAGWASAACCWSRSVAGACSGSWSTSPSSSELPPERLAEPIEALEAGVAAGARPARALGGARVLLDSRARAGAGAAARDRGRGTAGARPQADAGRGRPPRAARRSATARGSGRRQRAVLEVLRASGGSGASAAELAAGCGRGSLDPATPRGARARAPARGARSAPAAVGQRRRAARRRVAADRRAESARSAEIVAAMDDRADGARAPAPRRHRARARPRSTWRPRRRRWSGDAARSCSSPRSGSRPQAVARFRDRFGDAVALLHSRLLGGRALRRVAAAALGRGAGLRRAALGGLRAGRATSA